MTSDVARRRRALGHDVLGGLAISTHPFSEKTGFDVPGDAGGLVAFADALLPGDDDFPSASAVGAHGVMAARICDVAGAETLAKLVELCREHDVDGASDAAITAVEASAPALFDLARVALTYAYYETPAVIAVLRRMGFQYVDAPQPEGYRMRPFDAAIDTPQIARGHYVATTDMRRVDLSGLDFLQEGRS